MRCHGVAEIVQIPDAISKKLGSGTKLSLELGCGNRKRHPNAIGVDVLAYEGVDIVGDISLVLQQLPDHSIEAVYAYHCFEHLPDFGALMNQLGRILAENGKLLVVVPHFSNPYYYSDSTHRQPFGLYTFSYFAKEELFARRCPVYQRSLCFELKRVKLIFKSPRPFYGRWGIKKMIQGLVNLNHYTMEFYEENLCWLIPCYEIQYELSRL